MSYMLKSRIQNRLEYKGLNPFEAARMAGLERSFLNDLLIGKKQTIRSKYMPAIASTLDCDQDYLIGLQDTPRKVPGGNRSGHSMELVGICEAGAWRDVGYALPDLGGISIEPDQRYSLDDQECYLVRGDHAAGLGITDGSVVCIALLPAINDDGRSLRSGDVVLVERQDDNNRREFSIRVVEEIKEGLRLSAKPLRGEIPAITPDDNTKIVGLVLRAIRVFGLPA